MIPGYLISILTYAFFVFLIMVTFEIIIVIYVGIDGVIAALKVYFKILFSLLKGNKKSCLSIEYFEVIFMWVIVILLIYFMRD